MAKGDQILKANKNVDEIKINRTLKEDSKGINIFQADGNPMEIGEKANMNEEEKADKKWVKDAMDKLEKKVVKKEKNANSDSEATIKRRQEEELQAFALDNLDVNVERLRVKIPTKTVLDVSYGSAFADRVTDKKRSENKRNKKSRLYQKNANAALLDKNLKVAHDFAYENAKNLVPKDAEIDTQDFNDLAQFLVSGTKSKNKAIADLMLGGRNANGKACVDEHHAKMALVKMADQLVAADLSTIKMDTDHDIAENAAKLEALVNRIAAFERLSQKYNFFESLELSQRMAITTKLDSLKVVAAYFTIRKQIISDEMYKDHYNDELTMDVSKAKDSRQTTLAQKLLISFVLGKSMMVKCGVSLKNIDNMRVPTFGSDTATDFYRRTVTKYTEESAENLKELIDDNYKETESAAEAALEEIKSSSEVNVEPIVMVQDNEPIIMQEQARPLEVERKKLDKKDYVYGKYLTADEFTPLKDTKEYIAIDKGVEALHVMLTNTMPLASKPEDRMKEIDGTCVSVAMLYNRLIESIDKLIFRCGNDYQDCSSLLKTMKSDMQKENESFREKSLEYMKIMSSDPELSTQKHTWLDALKYSRGVFYDLDNAQECKYSVEGAGLSEVYKITKKVPVTKENKKGEEVVFFRKKDVVPPGDNDELIAGVVANHQVNEQLATEVKRSLGIVMNNLKTAGGVYMRINTMKRKKSNPTNIGKDILGVINKVTGIKINAALSDYEELGLIFKEWADTFAKRCCANERSNDSAKIDFGRNLSDRNVATSRFAALFGIQDMICDSRTATIRIGNKIIEGNIMDTTGGEETDSTTKPYSGKAISQLFQLQIFDFICGQTDRHYGNFHGIVKGGEIDQIRCLDNDMAFGNIKGEEAARGYNRICPLTDEALFALPPAFVNKLMAITRPYIVQTMGDILNSYEIDSLMDRLDWVKVAIINMIDKHKDVAKWERSKKKLSYTGIMADDEYRAMIALKDTAAFAKNRNIPLKNLTKFLQKNVDATQLDNRILMRQVKLNRGMQSS